MMNEVTAINTNAAVNADASGSSSFSVQRSSFRLLSLDVFRGMTIAGMILVNNPGSWSAIYPPLEHAKWHGWTPTDLIFPFFLFIVGVSITLALGRRVEGSTSQSRLMLAIVRRAGLIFLLGLLLSGFPYFELAKLRVPGVLQRIAVCYLVAALVFVKTKVRRQIALTVVLLVGYWLLMTLVPVPDFGAGDLSKEGNLAAYVDRALLAGHIYTKTYDPEGLLSTLPAIATVLCGILVGHWLRSNRDGLTKVKGMCVAGLAAVAVGWTWGLVFPINKPLWTSSYVLFTAGLASLLFALCYWLIEIRDVRRWSKPFEVFGTNAIAVFVLSALAARVLSLIKVHRADGTETSLRNNLYEHLFASWASPVNASLMFAIAYVLVWLGLMWILYRRRIFIKV